MNKKSEEKMSLKELVLLYHKIGFGDIAKTYSPEEENKFYNLVSSKLAEKYPKLVNHSEAYNLLKDNGQIVTINTTGQRGFFDDKRNIIGVKHFLDRLTTTIFHEIVHKYSFLIGNGEINKLPEVYREAGTEYITAETLKTKTTKACIFSNIWGRFPNTISSYFLEYIFVNQLNALFGKGALEDSILKGNLSFENRLKKQFGKPKYEALTKKMSEISKDFFYYAGFYNINSAKENVELRTKLTNSINIIQAFILKEGFDEKIRSATTAEEANLVLDSMLEFSDLRLRTKEDGKFADKDFKKYFNRAKKEFSARFPDTTFSQKFDPENWQTKYPEIEKVVQIPKEEEKKVKRMGKENYRKYKKSIFRKFFGIKNEEDAKALIRDEVSLSQTRNFNEELRVNNKNLNKDMLPTNKVDKKAYSKADKPRDVQ